jgi:hypothetical protein
VEDVHPGARLVLTGDLGRSGLVDDGEFSEQGETTVIRPSRSYEQLAVNRLERGFKASPAVFGKSLYLRTETHLYRIDP